MIFLVVRKLGGQFLDARGQQRDLDFRGTRITLGELVFLDNFAFLFSGQSHLSKSPKINNLGDRAFPKNPLETFPDRALCKSPSRRISLSGAL
jgi:hypothetical protein